MEIKLKPLHPVDYGHKLRLTPVYGDLNMIKAVIGRRWRLIVAVVNMHGTVHTFLSEPGDNRNFILDMLDHEDQIIHIHALIPERNSYITYYPPYVIKKR